MSNQLKIQIAPANSAAESGNSIIQAVVACNGTIISASAAMLQELGIDINPRQKANLFSFLSNENIEKLEAAFLKVEQDHMPSQITFSDNLSKKKLLVLEVSALPFSPGNVRSFLCRAVSGSLGNQTERTEMEIVKAVAPLFYQFSPDLAFSVDQNESLILANPAFLHFFGLDSNCRKTKLFDILPPQTAGIILQNVRQAEQFGRPLVCELELEHADTEKKLFRIGFFPTVLHDGECVTGIVASSLEESRKSQKEIAELQSRVEHISNVTFDAIWEWDMLTGTMYRNERLQELVGYEDEEMKGLSWWLGRTHPEDREQLMQLLKKVTEEGRKSWQTNYRFLCADGEYKHMHDRGFVLYENNLPVKMIGCLNDMTEQKLMEHLLSEEKMRQYRVVSETAIRIQEQERTRLGREMHDNVNQLLSTVKMFIELLKPSGSQETEIKKKAVDYTLMAIEEIRKLSREMVSPQLDGKSLVEQIQDMVTDFELSSGISVKCTHDAENNLLSPGKKISLYRIAQEQLKNIAKYSKATHVDILLCCKNNSVQMDISDNGIGFDTTKVKKGVGLDSIRDRAKFYNGTAEIVSATGKGCRLTIHIPLVD